MVSQLGRRTRVVVLAPQKSLRRPMPSSSLLLFDSLSGHKRVARQKKEREQKALK